MKYETIKPYVDRAIAFVKAHPQAVGYTIGAAIAFIAGAVIF
ncbi:MAG: hypothetical protein ACXWG8_10290 [Usitatibacter sp.]